MPWLCPVVQWSVHWAPSRTTWGLVLARTRHCALATCGKKMRAPLLGSAKSIYYYLFLFRKLLPYQENRIKSPYIKKMEIKQIQKDSLLKLSKITFKSKWFWGSFYFPLLYAHCLKRKKSIYFFPICLTCSYCTQQWNKWRKKSEDSKEYWQSVVKTLIWLNWGLAKLKRHWM